MAVQFAFEDYSFQQEGQLIGLFHGGLLCWRSDAAAVTWRRHSKLHGKGHFSAQWATNIQVASMEKQVQNQRWSRVCKRHCFAAHLIIRPNLHCNCSRVSGWDVLSFEGFFSCIVSLLFLYPSTYFLVTKIKSFCYSLCQTLTLLR